MKFGLAVLLTLAGANIASAAVLDDFEREAPEIPSSPAVKLAIADAPPGSEKATGKALAVDWAFPHAPWIEFAYAKPKVLFDKEPETAVGLRLETWQPAQPGMIDFAFRILDASGEVFQWGSRLTRSTEPGWQTLTFPIDAATANAHWAGNNNGRIEYPIRLFGYSMVFANKDVPAGRAWIDSVRVEPLPRITLETDRFPYLVNATGPAKCDLVISNPDPKPLSVALSGKLTSFPSQSADISGTIEVPANGTARFPIPIEEKRIRGYRSLDATLKIDGAAMAFKAPFVVADPLTRVNTKKDFLFSIASHTERLPDAEWESEFQAAAAAGASVMRVSPAWASMEPKAGEWKWDQMDRLVELGAKYGIEIQPILGFTPSHALPESERLAQVEAYKNKKADAWKIALFGQPEEAPWRRYVSAMATRYKGKVRLYEVWNEPDLGFWRGTTDGYITILRAASEEIRKADPQALVMTGGFATVSEHAGRAKNPDLQERVLKEAAASFDVHAIHQHGPFREFQGAIDGELQRIRSAMKPVRPLYFNETALSAFGNEKQQAEAVLKKMSFVMETGAIGYTWYDLRNDGTNPADAEHNYGLLTSTLKPKSAYAAYLEAVRRLQGQKAQGRLALGAGREVYTYGGPRARTIVWWNEYDTAGPVAALFKVPSAKQYDLMGNETVLPVVDGFVLAQSAADPRYLEFPAAPAQIAPAAELVKLDGPAQVSAGQPLNLKAVVTNPLARPIQVELSWTPPGGKKTSTLTVPANGTANLEIPNIPVGQRALTAQLDLGFAVQGTPWAGTVRYSAPASRTVLAAEPDGRAADWTISNRWEMISLTGADPALAALIWKNADDLSASVWLWKKDNSLRVRVDVKDDIHVQSEKAADIWKGDSIQMAIQGLDSKEGWELGAAQAADGTVLKATWLTPAGITDGADRFNVTCSPLQGGLRYEFDLPLDKMAITPEQFKKGLRFNLIVNDNDGTVREGFARLAPGLGQIKDVSVYPVVRGE